MNNIPPINLIKRKCITWLLLIKKLIIKYNGLSSGPIVIVNSFPKSGTHLLYQILEDLPELNKYNTFIASMTSVAQKERSKVELLRILESLIDGEIARAHLFYSDTFDLYIKNEKIIHLFIYRDPRDVVISEANYLFDMNPFHRLHKYFKKFPSIDDRIMFSIKGNDFFNTPINYPNIQHRFKKYEGWLLSSSTFGIKYEELVGSSQKEKIHGIISFFLSKIDNKYDINDLIKIAISNVNPTKSHTFREGGTQKWKKYFNDKHKKVFKEIGGELLIDLGYEKDLNW